MSQRGYAIAFFLVLLAACAGAFLGGRFLFNRVVGRGAPAPLAPVTVATPAVAEPADVIAEAPTEAPPRGNQAAAATATRTPTRMVLTPFVPPTPTLEPTVTEEPPSPTPAETATPEVTATPVSAMPFALAHAIRNSTGDCGGNLIVGRVMDANGNGLPDISLHLTDEFNVVNDTRSTKSAASEMGKYDFPLFGPGRQYFLTIVDGSGNPMSERLVVAHGVGPDAKATCHMVDWQRR